MSIKNYFPNYFSFFRDFSRFSEECQGYGVGGFERVTCVRLSERL